jgi:D-amino peptidase
MATDSRTPIGFLAPANTIRPVRVLIFGDMEGVAGICRWAQVNAGAALYEESRGLYTEEVNAAVRGAAAAGADEIVVMDCHGAGGDHSFNSLIAERLDDRCEFVVQSSWTEYTEPLERGCDAALLIGMHAMAGSARGVLSHTVSSTSWHELRFGATAVGEVAINAALCGTWGCPVALVTGDDVVAAEARALLGPNLETVAVKRGLGRFSARHLPPARARAAIEQGAREALARPIDAPVYVAPPAIAVELATPDHVTRYSQRTGVRVTGPRTVESTAADWWQAWRRLYL